MTGAGFGGCTVNIVDSSQVEAFSADVTEGYLAETGKEPFVYVCRPSDGVTSQRI
jgi:galactokinase